MNENVNKFFSNMGVICETWLVVYNQFLGHGLDHKAALEHTQAFMKSFMDSAHGNKGGDQ